MEEKKGFWTSLPGILTGIAAVITALTGLFLAFQSKDDSSNSRPTIVSTGAPSSPVAVEQQSVSAADQPRFPTFEKPAASGRSIDELRRLVAKQCLTSAATIDVKAPLKAQKCDDLDILEIVMAIEEKYRIRVHDSQIDLDSVSINTLAQIVHGR